MADFNNFDFDAFNNAGSVDVTQTANGLNTKRVNLFFNPKAKDHGGSYVCRLRFLPIAPGTEVIDRAQSYLPPLHEGTGESTIVVDSPRMIGQKDPIADLYFALKNSNNAVLEERAKKISSGMTDNYAYVQIIENQTEPETVGKIVLFKFGKTLMNMIDEGKKQCPEYDMKPVFHPDGPVFELKLTVKPGPQKYNDYTACRFVFSTSANHYAYIGDGDSARKIDLTDLSQMKEFFKHYMDVRPDCKSLEYKPWTPEQTNAITARIAQYKTLSTTVNSSAVADSIRNNSFNAASLPPTNASSMANAAVASASDDLDDIINSAL